MRLFALSAGMLGGLVLARFIGLPMALMLGLTPIVIAAALIAQKRGVLIASLLVLGLLVGAARGDLASGDQTSRQTAGAYVGTESTLTGVVEDTPSRRGGLIRLRVRLETARRSTEAVGSEAAVVGDAMAWLSPLSYDLNGGDRIALTGVPEYPIREEDESLNAQPTGNVLAAPPPSDFVILTRPSIAVLERATGPRAWLNAMRASLGASLDKSLPSPQAELARALLLGQRDDLPAELTENWRRAGTAHLLAISGLHVSVVLGVALVAGASLFGRRRYAHVLIPLAFVWFYAAMSGMNPPVMRAAIMGSVYLFAIAAGRQPSGGLALILAATALAMWEPSVIATVSFQLTVAAMAGIIFLTQPLEMWIKTLFAGRAASARLADDAPIAGWRRVMTTGIAASLGAVIGIKPLLLHYFGATALFTVPASALGTLALPPLLLTSAIVSIVGLTADGVISSLAGWLAWPWLTYLIGLSAAFAASPFSSVTIAPLSVGAVLLIYGAIIAIFWMSVFGRPSGLLGPMISLPSISAGHRRTMFTSWPVLGGLAFVAAVASLGAAAPLISGSLISEDQELSVHVLDIGQGDAILVESPVGRRVLIDGGPNGALLRARLSERLPWWSRRIDAVILTHPSADHISGLTEVVERFQVGLIIDPQLETDTIYGRQWQEALDDNPNMPVIRAERGILLDLGGGAILEFLHPPAVRPFDVAGEHDDNSVVIRVTYGEVSFLLSADIYAPAEKYLIESGIPLRAAVLKVPHQGSRYASTNAFLEAVSPRVAVISAGEGNRFGHPHPETLSRLENSPASPHILRTDQHGTITLTTDGDTLKWRSE